jgi:transcriptional regulator with XRE-family HTH domain
MRKLGPMRSVTVNGQALMALREERGLNQVKLAALLAEELGSPVHPTTISKYETEAIQPSPKRFSALCRVLKANGKRKRELIKQAAA